MVVEGVAFRVAEELFSVEPSLAHDMARKARDFAKGEYSDDVDGLERRGLNRRWLDSAQSLVEVTVSEAARSFIEGRGGRLYVWCPPVGRNSFWVQRVSSGAPSLFR